MDATSAKVRILLIRPWTESLAPIRAALRDAGFTARISRVDFEPALNAAMSRGAFDIIVFDPATKDVSLEIVEARVKIHGHATPIITFTTIGELVPAITAALLARLN